MQIEVMKALGQVKTCVQIEGGQRRRARRTKELIKIKRAHESSLVGETCVKPESSAEKAIKLIKVKGSHESSLTGENMCAACTEGGRRRRGTIEFIKVKGGHESSLAGEHLCATGAQ